MVLTVFVASPGDVAQEREALAAVASRINRITGRDWGWEIDLRGWEDTLPGYSRPQELINPDIDKCDIFIGVLWKRWGQPTGTHSSGFEEELERASRRRSTGDSPEIMLYLRDIDSATSRDPGPQLERVLEFRQAVVESRTVLSRSYSDVAEFEVLLFEHLMKVLGQRAAQSGSGPPNGQYAPEAALLQSAQTPPESSTLLELASDPLMTAGRLQGRWNQAADATDVPLLPCALGPAGLFRFDIFDRCHSATLVVGVTGSGKSETLLAIAASLALSIPPPLLRVSFLDLKSNSYVRALEELGAAGSAFEPEAAYSEVLAEVERRDQILVSAGCRDVLEFWAKHPLRRHEVPYWLLCVDEASGLMPSHEDGLRRLVAMALHGRALGIHMLFGSQIIAGVESGIRGVSTRRICLRVADHVDSLDVVGVPEAAMLSRAAPGTAIVREGSDKPQLVRFSWLGPDQDRIPRLLKEARGPSGAIEGRGRLVPFGQHSS